MADYLFEDELEKLDLIEGFLQNTLDQSGTDKFNKLFKAEEDFKLMVKDYTILIEGIEAAAHQKENIRERLKKLSKPPSEAAHHQEKKNVVRTVDLTQHTISENHHPQRKNWYWASAAAAITALLIVSVLFFTRSKDPEALFADNYTGPYPVLDGENSISRGQPTDISSLKKAAFFAYSIQNYSESINFFLQIPGTDHDDEITFYLGNAYLANGQAQKAIETLKALANVPGEFQVRSQWYLGLAYLKTSDPEQARATFQDLSKTGGSYGEKAKEMLEQM